MQTASPRGFSITPAIKREIIQIIDERIREVHVTKEDFSELKAIVKDLGIKVGELADAQKRTEQRVEELAEVQKRSELEIQKLAQGLDENNRNFGGLSRSMGYAFENEAFRLLPNFLRTRYGIDAKEKIVRGEIGGKEINLFARRKERQRGVDCW